jgi:hypothetical protein
MARLPHVEIRGPDFKGSLKGGTKTLFRFPGGTQPLTRLALTEAPIDALRRRPGTIAAKA